MSLHTSSTFMIAVRARSPCAKYVTALSHVAVVLCYRACLSFEGVREPRRRAGPALNWPQWRDSAQIKDVPYNCSTFVTRLLERIQILSFD